MKGIMHTPKYRLDLEMRKAAAETYQYSNAFPDLNDDCAPTSERDDLGQAPLEPIAQLPTMRLRHNTCDDYLPPAATAIHQECPKGYLCPCLLAVRPWLGGSAVDISYMQGYALLLTCRHIYMTALPILYKSSTFIFDEYHDYDLSSFEGYPVLSPAPFHAFCASVPAAQIQCLRSIYQRVGLSLGLKDGDLDSYQDKPEELMRCLYVDSRWKAFVDGNDAKTLPGLRGLPGLRSLPLEFCIDLGCYSGDERTVFVPFMYAFDGLKDMGVQKLHFSLAQWREKVSVQVYNAITAALSQLLMVELYGKKDA